jgi:hypothetical protein
MSEQKLEDHVITDEELALVNEISEGIFEEVFENEDVDGVAVFFNLFIDAIHILTRCGWTTENLIDEVVIHSEAE